MILGKPRVQQEGVEYAGLLERIVPAPKVHQSVLKIEGTASVEWLYIKIRFMVKIFIYLHFLKNMLCHG